MVELITTGSRSGSNREVRNLTIDVELTKVRLREMLNIVFQKELWLYVSEKQKFLKCGLCCIGDYVRIMNRALTFWQENSFSHPKIKNVEYSYSLCRKHENRTGGTLCESMRQLKELKSSTLQFN